MTNPFWLSDEEIENQGFTVNYYDQRLKYYTVPKDHPSGAELYVCGDRRQRYIGSNGLHNLVGPAEINYNGSYVYFVNGLLHRYDGPAYYNSSVFKHYYLHNTRINETVYFKWLEEMGMDIDNLTPEDKTLIDLKWGQDE